MAIEAELIYRAQNVAGRKDAAYVIQLHGPGDTMQNEYQVIVKWGSWERYRNATLQSKTDYLGTSRSAACSKVIEAHNKRLGRGYELQAHLSSYPHWWPDRIPVIGNVQPVWQSIANATQVATENIAQVTTSLEKLKQAMKSEPEPEPLPQGRVKHTRAGYLEL